MSNEYLDAPVVLRVEKVTAGYGGSPIIEDV